MRKTREGSNLGVGAMHPDRRISVFISDCIFDVIHIEFNETLDTREAEGQLFQKK